MSTKRFDIWIRLFRGRILIYPEPRDIWIGAYVSDDHLFVCLLPMLVIRISRDWQLGHTWSRS